MVFGGFFALLLLFRFSALPLGLALIGLPTSFVAHQLLDPYSDSDRSELDTEVIEATEATEAIEAIEEPVMLDYEAATFDGEIDSHSNNEVVGQIEETDADDISEYPFPSQNKDLDLSQVTGTWIYTDILKNGISVAKMQETDTLTLFWNKEFRYDIEALGKHQRGIFEIIEKEGIREKALVFSYLSATGNEITEVRIFDIEYLTTSEMRISEGALLFIFERKFTPAK